MTLNYLRLSKIIFNKLNISFLIGNWRLLLENMESKDDEKVHEIELRNKQMRSLNDGYSVSFYENTNSRDSILSEDGRIVHQIQKKYRFYRDQHEDVKKLVPWYIIKPDSFAHDVKEQFWVFLIFLISFLVPITICFDDAVASNPTAYLAVSVLVDVFFIIDLILNFFVAYRKKDGTLVISLEKLAKRFILTIYDRFFTQLGI